MEISKTRIEMTSQKSLSVPPYYIYKNKMIGLFGESGCGKSSLLENLYNKHHRSHKIHYMKQDIHVCPELTIREMIYYYSILRSETSANRIDEIIKEMGLDAIADQKIGSIEDRGVSGGEKKKIMIATALADDYSEIFLLDEPLSGLDDANMNRIIGLWRKKMYRTSSLIVIMTVHVIPDNIRNDLDEIWKISSDRLVFPSHDDMMIEIHLNDEERHPVIDRTSFVRQSIILFRRDALIASRIRLQTILVWVIPVLTVFIQTVFIGSISKHYRHWRQSRDELDLLRLMASFLILLFAASILPLSTLSLHFQKRSIIVHETSQGLFSQAAYLLNAIITDQVFSIIISFIIACIHLSSFELFFSVAQVMMFTNILMWFFSFFITSSFTVILLLLTSYISISFVSNLGFLIQFRNLGLIQYLSMIHIQTNIFVRSIHAESLIPLFDIHPFQYWGYLGPALWSLPVISIFIFSLFDLKKR